MKVKVETEHKECREPDGALGQTGLVGVTWAHSPGTWARVVEQERSRVQFGNVRAPRTLVLHAHQHPTALTEEANQRAKQAGLEPTHELETWGDCAIVRFSVVEEEAEIEPEPEYRDDQKRGKDRDLMEGSSVA